MATITSSEKDQFLKLLQRAIQKDASDIHLKTGSPPYYRIDGAVLPQELPPVKDEDMQRYLRILLSEEQMKYFMKRGEIDLAFTEKGVGRFRVNTFRQRGTISIVMRRIKAKILTFDQLHLPKAVERFSEFRRGLVLVTGTTGSGKSTSLAAIIDAINQKRRDHIVTIEDPIEFVHTDKLSVVNQREVTIDTQDFTSALKAMMRQDPDVILIGEMRDLETFQAAMSAAETGHLVFSTLHTTNVMLTIDRIVDLFPSNHHEQVRNQLAQNLQAIMSIRLIPRKDGSGRVPAVEILFMTPAARAIIKDNRISQLPMAIQQGRDSGSQTFNDSLHDLIKANLISLEEGINVSENPDELNMMLQGIRLNSQRGGILR